MATARPLTFETRSIDFVCCDCGKSVHLDLPVPASIGPVKFERCDDCVDTMIRRREQASLAASWRQRAESSGLPMDFIDWDRSKGNVELMAFIWRNRDKSLFIVDDYGTGKSRAMAAAAAKMMQERPELRVGFWSFPDLLTRYSGLMQDSMRDAERFKRSLHDLDLLVIDDVGKKKITDSGSDLLYWVVDKRYESSRPMWLSANLSANQLSRKFPDVDTANAIFDRLRRMMDDGGMMRWDAIKSK